MPGQRPPPPATVQAAKHSCTLLTRPSPPPPRCRCAGRQAHLHAAHAPLPPLPRAAAAQAGKHTYTLLMGKPSPAKLANFPEVEVFVHVADPLGLILDSKEYLGDQDPGAWDTRAGSGPWGLGHQGGVRTLGPGTPGRGQDPGAWGTRAGSGPWGRGHQGWTRAAAVCGTRVRTGCSVGGSPLHCRCHGAARKAAPIPAAAPQPR